MTVPRQWRRHAIRPRAWRAMTVVEPSRPWAWRAAALVCALAGLALGVVTGLALG